MAGVLLWPKGEGDSVINGHRYVDLGLSVKWATVNVGSALQEGAGDYYAWGETAVKSEYTKENRLALNVDFAGDIGGSPYDAVRAAWGGSWRLPTKEEFEELKDKCKWEWMASETFNGYKVTGPNGNFIYLPAGGSRSGYSKNGVGERGAYWTATPFDGDNAYCLVFDSGISYMSCEPVYVGRSVRPVTE